MKHYCLGFIFNENNEEVVLIKKQRPDWMRGVYNGIGGLNKPIEIPLDAMRRKVQQECGVSIQHWEHVFSLFGKDREKEDYQVWVFKCQIENFEHIETRTDEEIKFFPVDEIDAPVVNDVRWMIPLMLESHKWPVDFHRVLVPVNAKEKEEKESK